MSVHLKYTFIANCALFIASMFLDEIVATGTAVVIFVILGCTIEIIEAIEKRRIVNIDKTWFQVDKESD